MTKPWFIQSKLQVQGFSNAPAMTQTAVATAGSVSVSCEHPLNDNIACTLPCGPTVNAAFARSEAVTWTEAKSIPKMAREEASLLGPGLVGRSVTPRKVGPIRTPMMKGKSFAAVHWHLPVASVTLLWRTMP